MGKFGISLKAAGLTGLAAKLKAEQARTDRVERALDKAALLVERDAVSRAPHDSGEMVSKWVSYAPEKLRRLVGVDGARQAVFTEFSPRLTQGATVENPREGPWPYEHDGKTKGTKSGAQMPWIRPALYRNAREIKRLLRDAYRNWW